MGRNPKNFGADFITNLPDNIIDSILSRLPLHDAVRTSILSIEWRYKWLSIPELVFDFHLERTLSFNCKLENIVHHVFHHHQGPINKFALQVPSYRSNPYIDHWILRLSSSQVQDFTLQLFWSNKHRMTSHFFAFQNLKHLNLHRCVFNPPPQFKGFSRLITLDFQDVDFVPSIFGQFISQCPLLERMRLVGCSEGDLFVVEGPSLRFFTFHGVFNTIRFRNSPVLAEVSLSTPMVKDRGFKYFVIMPTVEKLHLHPGVLKFLGAGRPSQYPHILNCLRVLNLSMHLDCIEEVAYAFALARRSPKLQMLRVTLYASGIVVPVMEFIRAQKTPDCFLDQLRRVEIALFSGFEPQIELVRYLLASTAGLAEMVIAASFSALTSDVRLMNRLKQFPRASPRALLTVRK